MRHLFLALSLAACGSDEPGDTTDDFDPISDAPLAGVIGGVAWTFEAGETDSFLSDEDEFFATFSSEDGEACGFDTGPTDFILSVPTQIGTFAFTGTRNATFVVDGNENLITFDGTVRVDSISADTVEGAVYAYFDDDNEIDGTFTLTVCTE